MMWIAVHLAFAALPFVLTAALYSRKRRFPAGEGDARARDAKARKFYAQLLLVLLSTGACAALFSSRRTDRWLRGLSGRPRAFAVLALTAVAIGFVPGLYTVAVTAAYCLLAALFYPSARAMSECDGKEVEPGRAEPPATSAVPHRYDHRAGLPHDADGGSSDISAHDYHQ